MSTSNSTSEYLLLFRGSDWVQTLSPADLQKYLSASMAWFDRLSTEGKVKGGQPLTDERRIVSGKNGRVVSDGPFAESKEVIGGYLLLQMESYDEAVAIAQTCPALEYGSSIEVRPIAAECPSHQHARKLAAQDLAPAGV